MAVGAVAALEEEGDSVELTVVMVAVGGEIVGLVRIDSGASYVVAMIDNSFNLSVYDSFFAMQCQIPWT